MKTSKILKKWQFQLPQFVAASFLLFLPNINRSFASDDFRVLKRIAIDKIIWIKGFFRPVSDFTLHLNYLLGGFNPAGYYLFNILIHGINSFLLFRFCLSLKFSENDSRQTLFAFIASLLFLTYPFHTEGIVWILGRGASMATTFGLSALLIVMSDWPEKRKILLTSICYFLGLATYESIILLPIIILVLLYRQGMTRRKLVIWTVSMIATLVIHLLIRVEIAGSIAGSYGESFLHIRPLHYIGNFFKVTGRLFLPPVYQSRSFVLLFIPLILLLSLLFFLFIRGNKKNPLLVTYFSKLIIALSIASIVPILFSVSTKTSESDRFLYFPSCFLCCSISFLIINLFVTRLGLFLSIVPLTLYNVFFLEKSNLNWMKASSITKDILASIQSQDSSKNIFFINLPGDLEGAFIFRLGLKDALLINKVDPSRLTIVNNLNSEQIRGLPGEIRTEVKSNEIDIPPVVTIKKDRQENNTSVTNDHICLYPSNESIILYWDKQKVVRLE
ncbi:MAG: hypothetical protein C5B59_02630 [Bacteroidetes bacterium]|nr:MAG: hypothetical protein C5B59_02630 [Bacteroidota bacterium]